ncbi:hypothetical protein K1719_021634 [Acacia pycnantha]|nr:hypothetical protein K1719_021634 [Acacia pycnantha]
MFSETNNPSQPEQPRIAKSPSHFTTECWFDDACILDMDYFVKTLSGIKAKGVRADIIGSIIIHYASKWLPELSDGGCGVSDKPSLAQFQESPESVTTSWMKKRFFVETLVGVLPPEKYSIPCNFLLRLLRTANMVGVEVNYKSELENRISWQLDQASLKEIMIPSFSHTCETLLDVELVTRLVKRFVGLDVDGGKSGVALMKVAKLVDDYLAEAAVDANLSLSEFVALAGALPPHSRATDDGLYRAIDTYLKAHPGVSKQERKGLCKLIDCRKLSPEASLHAAQNERLPVRAVIQVLFSEQTKLNRHVDWSGSFGGGGMRSPNGGGGDLPARSFSKREMYAQQMEIRKLKEDVHRLQSQCSVMQVQMEKMMMEKNNKKGFFKWKKFGISGFGKSVNVMASSSVDHHKIQEGVVEEEVGFEVRQTPVGMKTKSSSRTPHHKHWRKSMS